MKVISARIEDKYFKDLKEIEKEEKADRAEVTRKLLARAIKEWKRQKALSLLKDHEVTIRKAAKIAEVSYAKMLDLASKNDIDIGYSLEDLEKDTR